MHTPVKILWLLVLITSAAAEKCATLRSRRQLLHHLMDDYEADLLPEKDLPIHVGVDMSLLSIIDLNEPKQTLDVNMWLSLVWRDSRLAWNVSKFDGQEMIHMASKRVWVPDIIPISSDHLGFGVLESHIVKIHSDGEVEMNLGTSVSYLCQLDMSNFPFDIQMCPFVISSYSYNVSFLHLFNKSNEADIDQFTSNGEWKVRSVPACEDTTDYVGNTNTYSELVFVIVMERRGTFYMFNIVMPCVMITLVSNMVFLLPPESGEKISMGITVLLSLCVFLTLVAEKLPATSRTIPLIGQYCGSIIILLSLICVLTVLVLKAHHCSSRPVPAWLRITVLQGLGSIFGQNSGSTIQPTNNTASESDESSSTTWSPCDEKNPAMFGSDSEKPPICEANDENNIPGKEQRNKEMVCLSHADDWKLVARILDRVFFVLVLVATTLCTVLLWVSRKPVNRIPCVEEDHLLAEPWK